MIYPVPIRPARLARPAFALAAVALCVGAACAATPEQIAAFAPYQAIIDRMPFGEPVAENVAAVQTADQIEMAKQEQELARRIGMCAVNITPGGVKVGFIDNSANPPKNYYLAVGESADGFALVDASYEDECATLEKDGVTITLKLGEGLVTQQPAAKAPAEGGAPGAGRRGPRGPGGRPGRGPAGDDAAAADGSSPVPGVSDASASADAGGDGQMSYSERLRRRRDDMRRERMERARAMREEVERAAEEKAAAAMADHEDRVRHEVNMELIRNGQQGLGDVELTPEEDAQLVEEGILDPQ